MRYESLIVANRKIEELESWKEQASSILNELKLHEIGNILVEDFGLKWGDRIAPNILPYIQKIRSENQELKRLCGGLQSQAQSEWHP